MINVVHLITSLDTGGAEIMLGRLVENMDRNRFRNIVISLTDSGIVGERISAGGIPVKALGMQRGRLSAKGLIRLWRYLREYRPEVLQTWLYHSDLIGLATGRAAGVSNIAWNIRCSVTDERYQKGINGFVVKALARLSALPDAVISNSQAGRDVHERQGYHPRRWVNLPNGVQVNLFSPNSDARTEMRHRLSIPPQTFAVGLVGRYDPLKNHSMFIEAAALFAKEKPDSVFVLVGYQIDKDNKALTDQIAEAGLSDRFRLLGERTDIPEITRALDVATCSSLGEGFPTVIAEAMASGVPCVSTDVGDAAIIIGKDGFVVPNGDPHELAGGWKAVADLTRDEYDNLSRSCRNNIIARYSLDAITRQYEGLYTELADN